ncbi:MAG: pyrroline-5-carboxylate reductase [Desulfonatronovibrionaceae bacterium]
MQQVDIGIIGLGNMGGAIAEGLVPFADIKVRGYDPDPDRFNRLEAVAQDPDPLTVAEKSQYLILAVKPGLISAVTREVSPALDADKCLVSVAAGIRMSRIAEACGRACPVVRVMPNTPTLVGQGVFALCLEDERLGEDKKEFLTAFFSRLGDVHVLPEEHFDAFTALIGSGPAYVYYFMESLIEAGVTLGLPRDKATSMVTSLVSGSVTMLKSQGGHPVLLKEQVSSPAGTTIIGLNELDRRRVKSAFIQAVIRARDKSREIGS